MPKHLFQITDTRTGKPVEGLPPFASKPEAKKKREELNVLHQDNPRYIVSPGPDHHHFRKPS